MPIFSSADITRFTLAGEQEFASAHKCISARAVIPIVSGTSLYTLSDSILSIIQITYQGRRLDPVSHRDLRESMLSGTQSGTPYNYIYNNIGQLKVQLFPVPAENIPDTSTDLYKSPDIETFCIAEYWQLPDGINYTLPLYFRRRLLKAYVMKELFAIEGKGQNIKACKYFTKMYEVLSKDYAQILSDLYNRPRNLHHGYGFERGYRKVRPVLPIGTFGESVDY